MSFGRRRAPEPPQIPAQPAPQEVMDIIDEIAGTQTITAIGPDGRRRRVTQAIRTPEEQQIFDQSRTLMRQALNNIQQLYQYNPNLVADYQPFINTFAQVNQERAGELARIGNFDDIAARVDEFKAMQKNLVNREFDKQQRMSEESLARKGLGRSTTAAETRAAMASERALVEQQTDVNANLYGEDLANRRLNREVDAYNARDIGRQNRLAQAEAGVTAQERDLTAREGLRRNAIDENLAYMNIGQSQQDANMRRASHGMGMEGMAQNANASANNNANARYSNEVNRLHRQNEMSRQYSIDRGPTFGQRLGDFTMNLAGQAAGSAVSAGMGGFGAPPNSSFGARFGENMRGV
jgi:hypothetical protein